jgi:hypothetical protein
MEQRFFEFLKENDAFEAWNMNFCNAVRGRVGDLKEKRSAFLRDDNVVKWIRAAFAFTEAREPSSMPFDQRYDFWQRTNRMWEEIIRAQQ